MNIILVTEHILDKQINVLALQNLKYSWLHKYFKKYLSRIRTNLYIFCVYLLILKNTKNCIRQIKIYFFHSNCQVGK